MQPDSNKKVSGKAGPIHIAWSSDAAPRGFFSAGYSE